MGTVYLARSLAAGGFERQVALKVMHPHLLADHEFVEMFLSEARLAARILHPNVVATHDVQQLSRGLFLVMDYVPGPSLHSILEALRRRGQRLPIGICLTIFLDVLAGLHAAHELRDADGQPLNIIHRDISPDNVLISQDGIARLTDFGLARAQTTIGTTRGGRLKGKLAFLAPEVVLFGMVNRGSDLYAVGVSLWEALTLRRLFTAENDGMLLAMVIEGASRTPRSENPDVPQPISSVCMQALQKELALRFQTADELAEALRDAAREAGIEPTPAWDIAEWLRPILQEEKLLELVPEQPSTRPLLTLAEQQAHSHGGTAVTSPGRQRSRVPLVGAVAATIVLGAGVGAYLASSPGAGVSGEAPAARHVQESSSPFAPGASLGAASSQAAETAPAEALPSASAGEAQDAGSEAQAATDEPSAAPKAGPESRRPVAAPRATPVPKPMPEPFDPDRL
jgi:serine/threonine protein kinase